MILLLLARLWPLACGSPRGSRAQDPAEGDPVSSQDVLVILVDDLGYGDTSIDAYTAAIQEFEPGWAADLPTPNLAALAAAGRSYTRYRASGPVCSPTRAALLTGLQPHRAGLWKVAGGGDGYGADLGLKPGTRLLPELLAAAGYETAAVGKWHIGTQPAPWGLDGGGCLPADTPDQRGFGRYFGLISATHDYVIGADCADLVRSTSAQSGLVPAAAGGECPFEGRNLTEVLTDEALIQARRLERSGAPWLLYVAYTAPHAPGADGAAWIRERALEDPAYAALAAGCAGAAARGYWGEEYCLLVGHMDAEIGRLLAGIEGEPLVIFSSDNGGDLEYGARNDPFRGGKGEVYGGGLVVPLVLRGPGVPAGTVSDLPLTTSDLFPTILEAAGVPVPAAQAAADFVASCDEPLAYRDEPLEGASFWGDARGGASEGRSEAVFEYLGQIALAEEIAGTRWTLVGSAWSEEGPRCDPGWELYDEGADPAEEQDVSAEEPEIAAQLQARAREWVLSLPQVHPELAWFACCAAAGGQGCEAACGPCVE